MSLKKKTKEKIMDSDAPRLMLIELNEFSVDLFERGVRELKLPSIQRMLGMRSSTTTTDDMVEHRGLDPWVQWVSMHTGVPSSVHGIIHLGDAPAKLGVKQLWEQLSDRGITSGIWGAMNATRGNAKNCKFFLPDPWTFTEMAYPEKINDLLALPRYYSKNYLDVSKHEFVKNTLKLAKYVFGSGALWKIIRNLPLISRGILRNGINNAMLFSLFDLFSATLFLQQRRRAPTQFSLIFLNSIAHLQHHRWEAGNNLTKDVAFGLLAIDRVLEMIFADAGKHEAIMVMNALTQRNISHEKPRICYRQINPARFLQAIGLDFKSVEQLMTNDAHVFFETRDLRDAAAECLKRASLQGLPLFDVDTNASDDTKLFYQVDFWEELAADETIEINGRTINFLDHFEAIVARTGAHVREGNVFYHGFEMPSQLYNHEVGRHIINFMTCTRNDFPVHPVDVSAIAV
jgi:hypothetical protein